MTKGGESATIGGTMNPSGALVIEARKVGRNTMPPHIVQLVAAAQRSHAQSRRLANQASR